MRKMNVKTVLVILLGLILLAPVLQAKVIMASVSVTPAEYSGQCPKRFEFVGEITSDTAGVVQYTWIRSDGATSPVEALRFGKAGTMRVTTYWELGAEGQHWQALQIVAPNQLFSNRATFSLKCVILGVVQLANPLITGTLQLAMPLIPNCPDPAAFEIRFQIVRRNSQFQGLVRITGVVKNVGGKSFVSGPNQAKAYLYQLPAGVPCGNATGGTIVAQQEIRNLAPGATMELIFEREWNSSSPNEGEFPNCYRLIISYDPDIYMDSNVDNDDCNQNNNTKDRSGTEINQLFR